MGAPERNHAPNAAEQDTSAALRAFFNISEKWDLTIDQQMKLLGSPPRSTFFKWKKDGGHLSQDTVERLSHVLSIYKCLRIVFTDEVLSHQWVQKSNQAPFLNGVSAIDFMTANGFVADIFKVRAYLDSQRGG
jgi:SOS-response transcriptional repressor LexA